MVYVYPRVYLKSYYDTSLANGATANFDTLSCTQDEILLLTNISAKTLANLMLTISTNDNISFTVNLAGADNLTEKGIPVKLLASQQITLSLLNSTGSPLSGGSPGLVVYRYEILPRSILAKIIWNQSLEGDPKVAYTEAWIAEQFNLVQRLKAGLISPRLLIEPSLGVSPSD